MYNFLLSYCVSAFCGWGLAFLVPLIMQELTHSALYTSATYAASYLPYILIMPIGGVLADFFNKKKMMQFLELANVVLISCLVVAIFIFRHPLLILLIHFMLCAIVAVQHPVFQGMIPAIVSKDKAKTFHSLTGIISNIISLAAPGITGLLLIYCEKKMIFYGLAAGYFLGFLLISCVQYHQTTTQNKWTLTTILQELKEAFSYICNEPFFIYTTILAFFSCFSSSFINSNLIHYLKNHHHLTEKLISYCYIPMGVGSIIGSMLANYIVGRVSTGKVLLYSSLIQALTIGLLLVSPRIELLIGLRTLNNLLLSIYIVGYFTHRQKITPPHLLSRTVALTRMLAWAPIPLASLLSGFLLEKTGNFQYLIIASSMAIFLGVVIAWRGLMKTTSTQHKLEVQKKRIPAKELSSQDHRQLSS